MLSNLFISCYVSDAMCSVLFKVLKTQVHLIFIAILWRCCCLVAKSCPALWDSMDCSMSGFPVLHCLPEFAQIHVHWVGDAIQPSHPLSSPSATFKLSQHHGLFKWGSSSHQYWSFSFSISPSNEYSGLVSFRIDWLDLLVVQGTLKSLLQHHSLKA